MAFPEGGATRRHDIDFLRIAVFGLMIVYHTSLIFGTRSWLINAEPPVKLFDLISVGSHPWRLSFLFFISGMVTVSQMSRRTPEQIRFARSRQLLPPLLFGVFVLVPPQIYVGFKVHYGLHMSYAAFWKAYMLGDTFTDATGEVHTFADLAHLWFLAYLWIYTVIWTLLQRNAPMLLQRASLRLARLFRGKGLLVWPILYLAILRWALFPVFGETRGLVNDWYAHAVYVTFFLAGTLLMGQEAFWDSVAREKGLALLLSAVSFMAIAAVVLAIPPAERSPLLVVAFRLLRSAFQWSTIVAILAVARETIRAPNPVITYLNKAVLTYYVVHQTVVVLAAYWLAQHGLLQPWSFGLILVATCAVCGLAYEVPRRIGSLWAVPRQAPADSTAGRI